MPCRKHPSFLSMTVAIKGTMLAALSCSFVLAAPAIKATEKKAVSLSPHLTELVYAAGAGDHLLGVSEHSNYPPAVGTLPKVGSGVTPNVERIALLGPDMILAWGYKNSKDLYPALRKLNIPVHYQAPASLDRIIDDIGELGALFGTQAAADATARELREILRSTRQRYQNAAKIKTFILVSQEPLYTLGAGSFVIDALHACGAESAFATLSAPAPIVSKEQLLFAQPQAVLFGAKNISRQSNILGRYFSSMGLPLQPDQLLGMDPDIVFRPAERLIRKLPELCGDIDRIRRRLAPAASESPLPPPRHLPSMSPRKDAAGA
ncbi:iron complex transport system substrate-binding protein/vitamin B12 transport system substrate-binding protein [Advenella incenata]|uniref:Iron complex transport system substrate-binding protein/vitamin B12 transport system substrate-binding protein n=1 Tax=Advenella incenata TaxID=267800 RepID=A0A4Q7VFJ5_9BURK|nr:helical backbone metal receptor [Advenella incenata]RZT94338.1 iron complex transport system substrate-binding protein/vitamin B12 transport system substrate-binding protein [Advenella incenata]